MALEVFVSVIVPLLIIFFVVIKTKGSRSSLNSKLPKSYPVIGSYFEFHRHEDRYIQWTAEIVNSTSNLTFTLNKTLGQRVVFTANPENVQHILKTHIHLYGKGQLFNVTLRDLLGDGIFNADGDKWKVQRQLASHEFNTRSLRKFIETAVDSEVSNRLIPVLRSAVDRKTVLNFQDVLQRFAFDNICKIAFGYDPEYLSLSMEESEFAVAFESAVRLSSERFNFFVPALWRLKRAFNLGAEKELKAALAQVQDLARGIINRRKRQIAAKSAVDEDLLSRFLTSGNSDERFVMDMVVSFIIAGKDTTSAALTWFFWLLSRNPEVEKKIQQEIDVKVSESAGYDEVKDMVYTHASISESMRLYPPVPMDTKCALNDDILPDGTVVKKGMRVTYHPYAMGRVEKVWGADWAEYRPERWLQKAADGDRLVFVNKDPYTYPVFQAGPRICLGKDMAFLQMKRIVAAVLRDFRVVPVTPAGDQPVFLAFLTAKMKGGFPVKIEARNH